jgi:hypothetical protein
MERQPTLRLPPVERLALFSPDDPEQLHAYSRGLLAQLLRIRGGSKPDGYPIKAVKVAAVDLLGAYQSNGVPLHYETFKLIAELFGPRGTDRDKAATGAPVQLKSRAAYYAALRYEASKPADPQGKKPSSATTYEIAKHLRARGLFKRHSSADLRNSAEQTVEPWRKSEHYRSNVPLLRLVTTPQS